MLVDVNDVILMLNRQLRDLEETLEKQNQYLDANNRYIIKLTKDIETTKELLRKVEVINIS